MLIRIQAGKGVSQRALAEELGLALSYVNRLLKRAIQKRWVRVSRSLGARYVLTPTGARALQDRWRGGVRSMLGAYAEARLHVDHRMRQMADRLSGSPDTPSCPMPPRDVVFYGLSELTELAYVSLVDSGFNLVGVVDDRRSGSFFGLPIQATDNLAAGSLSGSRFDAIVVVDADRDLIAAKLERAGIEPRRVFWL